MKDPTQDIGYIENMFSRKEYHRLYDTSSSSTLKNLLRASRFRDKAVQRKIVTIKNVKEIFYCPFNKIPLYINIKSYDQIKNDMIKDITRWRLTIHK